MPHHQTHEPSNKAAAFLLLWPAVLLVAIASIFRGGNRSIPLTVIEWLALLVCAVLVWGLLDTAQREGQWAPKSPNAILLWVLASSPLWVGLLQLGRGASVTVWASLLAGAPIAACFLLALTGSKEQTKLLARIWISAAVVQASLGLLQTTGAKALYFDFPQAYGSLGTFANRNNLANFIAMTLPWVFLALRPPINRHRTNSRQPWLWGAVLFVLIAALLASQSRMGISTGLLVLAMSAWAIGPQKKLPRKTRLWVGLGTLTIVALALMSGGWQWLNRFDSDYLEQSALFRENLRLLTWNAAMAYWPFGAGLGMFSLVFPAFQSADISGYVNHAHNDYLQLLVELGFVFVLLLLAVVGLVANRIRQLAISARAASGGWTQQDYFSVASGLGVLAIALHAWVDFPMRIPANAMLGAFLLGAFLRSPEGGGKEMHKKATLKHHPSVEPHG